MSAQPANRHWAAQKERGSFVLMKATALAVRWLGRRPLAPLIYLIVLYFFVSGRPARRHIADYQARLARWSGGRTAAPNTRRVFAQFMNYADSLLDRLDVWRGKLRLEQVTLEDLGGVRHRLRASVDGGRGEILVGAHLGNLDVCRALAELGEQVPLNVLVHTAHVAQFNRLQREAGDRHLNLLQVSELDAATLLMLAQRVERGEWLAIAGDRVPLHGGRRQQVQFLGAPAALPQGPWLLAALLRCPVNLMCCLKIAGRYHIVLEPFLDAPELARGQRDAAIAQWAQRYAQWLGELCLRAPLQWFNFFAFWQTGKESADA